MPRIFLCHMCRVVMRAPDLPKDTPMVPAKLVFKTGEERTFRDEHGRATMVPKYDPMLEDFVSKHEHDLDARQFIGGQVVEAISVDPKTWNAVDMMSLIRGQLHEQTAQWYEDRDFYREGAIRCYNEHNNPTLDTGCPDYLDDSKMIGKAKYEEDGVVVEIPPKFRQYLCYQCPYQHAYVDVEKRRKAGLYK